MTIDVDIQKIARLAQLEIEPHEVEHYHNELQRIFKLIEQMASVNVEGITPMTHSLDTKLITRNDEVTENVVASGAFEKLQQVAPQVEHGLYLVPQVIE